MIVLFTDFGLEGPYTGQVKTVLHREAAGMQVVDLFADAPAARPFEAAYLLAAYAPAFPEAKVFLCVVDPGVGTDRPAEALRVDGRWFVGPGNGLFELVLRRSRVVETYRIAVARPVSATFHGRDIFAPAAARLARGDRPSAAGLESAPPTRRSDWPDDLAAIVYIDHYGNIMTGLRAVTLGAGARIELAGRPIIRGQTFGAIPPGTPFWYENANGLVEIAVPQGRADALPGCRIGAPVGVGL